MRPNTWAEDRAALVRDIDALVASSAYGDGKLPIPVSSMLDCELVLTLMADHFAGEDPQLAWAVLNGHPFPAITALPAAGCRAVAVARLHVPALRGRVAWERILGAYCRVPAPYALYTVDGHDVRVESTSIPSGRREMMRTALRVPPPIEMRQPRYAKAGRYQFHVRREVQEVELGERAVAARARPVAAPDVGGHSSRSPLRVPLADLILEAEWMDRHAPQGSAADRGWAGRISGLEMRRIGEAGLVADGGLALDGLVHMVGMVGSGKSSLLTVLTVYLARRGYRVTLVQGDVATLLREQAVFEALRPADPSLLAVPFVGRSTRIDHLNRLQRAEAQRVGASLGHDHPAYAMLSTVCPLDGLRRDVAPIRPGEEPCTRLYAIDPDDTPADAADDCPLMPACPVQLPTRQLADAPIWLATPASLLVSGPQQPLVPHRLRNVEMVMRAADVVLVDEADLVQTQFDDRYAPQEVLVGRGESWLDRLAVGVPRQVYKPGRPLVGRRGLDHWLTAHSNAQQAVDRLYTLLRESAATRHWLGASYFSGRRLLQRVEETLERRGVPTGPFTRTANAFHDAPLGGRPSAALADAWRAAAQRALLTSDTEDAREQLRTWLASRLDWPVNSDLAIAECADQLLVALMVVILDHSLQGVIAEWPAAAEVLDLDRGSGGMFFAPMEALVRLVPEAPMGAILGFQYHDPDKDGNGELRFFRMQGLGRGLLYHLHDALAASHGLAGPHVVLTSGTSWAPGSWRYDLHVPPAMVLLPRADEDRTADTWCAFEPLPDPDNPSRRLTVSGLPQPEDRLHSLRAMVRGLCAPRGFDPCRLDEELAALPEDRRRILLVVGSYDEARAVGETLAAARHGDGDVDDVLTLVRDRDDEDTWRSPPGALPRALLAEVPVRGARFLVAPLQAIERGHNILVGQRAAIGSVYFLVRPLPRPGELDTAVHRINAWAVRRAPSLVDMPATEAGLRFRREAGAEWDRLLQARMTYKGSDDPTGLLWTQLVLVWQCIGRLLRGGVPARVHFIDAAWAENSARGEPDTEHTSMLLGFARILDDATNDPDPAQRAIARTLYGAATTAFSSTKGIYRD